MAKKKEKAQTKPKPSKTDKQVMDGLDMPFEDLMKALVRPEDKQK